MKTPNVLAIIPARSGSKGIPLKNIRLMNEKPLIYWTIKAALNSKYINKTIVSTDDERIANISKENGAEVPFLRPTELAQDSSQRNDVVNHILSEMPNYDYIILLQPTSPLRTHLNIDEAFKLLMSSKATSCVSVVEQHPGPEWMYKIDNVNRLCPILFNASSMNRQQLPHYYSLNGSIYITCVKNFLKSKSLDPFFDDVIPYIMKKRNSIDIDDHFDFEIAEFLLKNTHN